MDTFKFEVGDITINTVIQAFIGMFLFVLTIMFNTSNDQSKESNIKAAETNRILTKLTAEIAKLNSVTDTNKEQILYVGQKADKNADDLNKFINNHKEKH